jgi:hypothetical protein
VAKENRSVSSTEKGTAYFPQVKKQAFSGQEREQGMAGILRIKLARYEGEKLVSR